MIEFEYSCKIKDLGFTKFNEIERTYELDEDKRPEKCYVIAIKGDKNEVQEEYQKRCRYYRFTYNGIGIYEAVKQKVSFQTWKDLLKSPRINWLPKPNLYEENYKSFFTKKGYDKFMKEVKPIFNKYLDFSLVKEERYIELNNLIYEDEYQVITK